MHKKRGSGLEMHNPDGSATEQSPHFHDDLVRHVVELAVLPVGTPLAVTG
jgi:hypothetical protein